MMQPESPHWVLQLATLQGCHPALHAAAHAARGLVHPKLRQRATKCRHVLFKCQWLFLGLAPSQSYSHHLGVLSHLDRLTPDRLSGSRCLLLLHRAWGRGSQTNEKTYIGKH